VQVRSKQYFHGAISAKLCLFRGTPATRRQTTHCHELAPWASPSAMDKLIASINLLESSSVLASICLASCEEAAASISPVSFKGNR
jgi:hypothetical protein